VTAPPLTAPWPALPFSAPAAGAETPESAETAERDDVNPVTSRATALLRDAVELSMPESA
jgi:hypothetical protein